MIEKAIFTGMSILKTFALSSKIKKDAIYASFNNNDIIEEPPYNVSIVMPSYNEENLIEYALKSIKEQNILMKYPEYFEIVLVDSESSDNTVKIAKKYVNKIILSPRGKLTARNVCLKDLNGDIIVSVDSDCYYPLNWLNLLLKPFKRSHVVATSGFTIDYLSQYPKFINELAPLAWQISLTTIYKSRMSGRNSAYYKHLQELNLFNEDINQYNANEMIKEEEISFGKKLAKYGSVIYNNRAACLHLGSMKIGCRDSSYNPQDEIDKVYCDEIRSNNRF